MATALRTARRSLLFGALAVALVLVAPVATPASAQTGSLELVAQSAWVDDGGIFDLQVRVAGAEADASVVIRVHQPLRSRLTLISGVVPEAPPLLDIGPIPLDQLQTTSNEILPLQIAIVGPRTAEPVPDLEEDEAVPVLRTDGGSAVYPLEVGLLDATGNVTDSVRTHLIELPRGWRSPPLEVALVLGVDLPPGIDASGNESLTTDATNPLATLVDAMEIRPETPVALDILPETMAALSRSPHAEHRDLVDRLTTLLATEELLPNAHVEVSEQAWLDAELDDQLAAIHERGRRAVSAIIGAPPDPSVAILDPTLTPGGLDWLVGNGVQGVLVHSDNLAPIPGDVFGRALTRRFLVPTEAGNAIPALEIDRHLGRYFNATDNPVLNANLLLADLTMLALEDPPLRRAAIVVPTGDWTPNLSFLNVLMAGLERIPVINAATPKDALSRTEFAPEDPDSISPPLRRELRPLPLDGLGAFRTQYNQAAATIDSWAAVLASAPDATHTISELLVVAADERLPLDGRVEYIDTIYRTIEAQKRGALVTPRTDRITLTGRETELPVIIENTLAVDASVVLVLDSEKLAFPEGNEIPVQLVPGSNRIEIPIEALASGDSPIRIQIFSPDRSVLLGSSEVVVRTLAFSGAGIVIGVLAIIVLIIWWLRHSRPVPGTLEPAPSL